MDAMLTILKPACLARAGAIPCRGCGACGRSGGGRVPDVSRTERERIAGEHFRSLRGLSAADAPVTACARQRVDEANPVRRRQYVTTGDAAVAAIKSEWALNKVNEHGVTLQDEFGGDYESFAGYASHCDAGCVTILERKDSRADSGLSVVLSTRAVRSEWEQNVPDARGVRPTTEFGGDFEAYSAYCRAVAAGRVRLVVNSPGLIKG